MSPERSFLVLGAASGLIGVTLGAFGTHALRARLSPERLGRFETAVRYQVWHAVAIFAVEFVGLVRFWHPSASAELYVAEGDMAWPAALAGWLFVAGTVLFSGSLYILALTGKRRWGIVTPLGGACFILGWASLVLAAATA